MGLWALRWGGVHGTVGPSMGRSLWDCGPFDRAEFMGLWALRWGGVHGTVDPSMGWCGTVGPSMGWSSWDCGPFDGVEFMGLWTLRWGGVHGTVECGPFDGVEWDCREVIYIFQPVLVWCRIICVRETRVTGICSHILIGLSLLFIEQLKKIPRPVLDGLFLYLAITALHSNQLFERIMLMVTEQVRGTLSSNRIRRADSRDTPPSNRTRRDTLPSNRIRRADSRDTPPSNRTRRDTLPSNRIIQADSRDTPPSNRTRRDTLPSNRIRQPA